MIDSHPHSPLFLALLAVIFMAVIGYMVWYNLRLKKRQHSMEGGGRHMGTEEGIAASSEAEHQAHLRKGPRH
ncbi:MAG TPA: hypothetical protein VM865_06745 [Acidobacteriaceae bacterium]|jgi:hypothetical protein|nr:hypothetical protein [Acidobacteriaceae bacterium]